MRSPLADLFNDLNVAFEQVSSRWYLFGAQAAILHGAARLTADVDVTVMYGGGEPSRLLRVLAVNRFDASTEDAIGFMERTRVLPVIHTPSGIPVDIVFGGPGLEEQFLQRSRLFDLNGAMVPVASAEDLVAMKILSGRAKDLDDVLAVLAAQLGSFDVSYSRVLLERLEAALDRRDLLPVLEDMILRLQ